MLLFQGDFETGDLTQWTYLLKEEGLSVVMDPVAEGTHAGKVTITKNELWPNGLNRVEVQYQPEDEYTAEGTDIYYGYSFYLPEELTDDEHQILYWETDSSVTGNYQQMMQVAVMGQRLRFATQKPSFKVHWEEDGLATAGVWHRLAIHIKFDSDPAVGSVDLWFDGQQVVTGAKAQTFVGDPVFVQHGILRDTIDKVETLYLDDGRCGTTLEDVLAPANMGGGGSGGAGGGGAGGVAGNVSAGGGGETSAGTSSGGASGGGASAGGSTGGSTTSGAGMSSAGGTNTTTPGATDDGGCGCRAAGSAPSRWSALASLLLAALLWRRAR